MAENVQTPDEVAWGTQTQLAIANFPISGRPVDPRLLRALARIKAAAAVVNAALDEAAAAAGVVDALVPVLQRLARVLRRKSREFATVVKAGRIHLMDATPITLGAEFGSYATQIESNIARLVDCIPRVCVLPLGGTAVG